MANNYTIPFGIDAKDFFSELDQIEKGVGDMNGKVSQANESMQKGFDNTTKSAKKLDDGLKLTADKAALLSAEARELGTELRKAMDGKGVSPELENKLKNFTSLMTKFTANTSKKLKFDVDTAKLETFNRMLEEGADDLQVLNQVIGFSKEQLAQLDPNSEEWAELNAQINIAEEFMKGLNTETEKTEGKQKSLKAQLREMKTALAEMELAGKGNTEEFRKLSIEAGELEDQIGDISARVKALASDTKKLDAVMEAVTALAGGFAAAQGAIALFGSESEEVNLVLQKVSGAMAILQGVQAVMNALNKDSALSVIFFSKAQKTKTVATVAATAATTAEAGATVAATTATKAWTVALLANPIFIIGAVIVAATTAIIAFTSGQNDAADAADRLNKSLETQKNVIEFLERGERRRVAKRLAEAKEQGKAQSELLKIERSSLFFRQEIYREELRQMDEQLKDRKFLDNLSEEEKKEFNGSYEELENEFLDIQNEVSIKDIEIRTQRNQEVKELLKKSEEQAKKSAEERKKIAEQQLRFTRELESLRIQTIKDSYERETAEAQNRAINKIQDLQFEKALSIEAVQTRNDIIVYLTELSERELQEITKKYNKQKLELMLEADRIINDLRKDSEEKEVEAIRISYIEKRAAIEETYKDEEETRKRLLRVINQSEQDELKKIRNAYALQEIERESERLSLLVELSASYIGDSKRVELEKQTAILEIQMSFAQKRIDELISQGNAESSLVVLQAKKVLADLRKEYNNAAKQMEGENQFDLFKFLGLGDLTSEQKKALEEAINETLKSIKSITDLIVGEYQRQIDARQSMIDSIEESIDTLEDQLDREKEFQERGFSNNVELIQAEIDAKKRQKEEELRTQEEIQKKQKAVAKAQLVVDTIAQTSNLITAATKIINGFSSIPIVGVGLGIAAVALMIGAFVAMKVKAFQAVNQGGSQSFGGGGKVDGKSHAAGGKKYIANDNSGDVVELEGGEYVIKKSSTQKHERLLEAINNDEIGGLSDQALHDLLRGTGVRFDDEGKEAIKLSRDHEEAKHVYVINQGPRDDFGELAVMKDDLHYLAERKRNDPVQWESGNYYYTKRGNTITREEKK